MTAQLEASQAEARAERAKLQLTIDSLVAKIDALLGKKTTKGKETPPAPPGRALAAPGGTGERGRQGYPMASATIRDVVQRALAEPHGVARVVWKAVQALPDNHSDATGLPVVLDDKDHTHLGQMFVFGWGTLAAFRYSTDKEGASFTRMSGSFEGTLVLDASSTHNDALADGTIRWAGCNAHGLRKLRDATESDPVLGAEGERWIASWFDKEREVGNLGLPGDELLAWRRQHISPRVRGFKEWLKLVHPTVLPTSPLAESTRYDATYWRRLTAFLRDPNLPLEYTFAQRNLRAQALGRTNGLFAVGHEAAENTAVACTLVQTAKLHGLDVQAYLTRALERVAVCKRPGDDAALTPMADENAQKRAGDRYTVRHPALRSPGGRRRAARIGGGLRGCPASVPGGCRALVPDRSSSNRVPGRLVAGLARPLALRARARRRGRALVGRVRVGAVGGGGVARGVVTERAGGLPRGRGISRIHDEEPPPPLPRAHARVGFLRAGDREEPRGREGRRRRRPAVARLGGRRQVRRELGRGRRLLPRRRHPRRLDRLREGRPRTARSRVLARAEVRDVRDQASGRARRRVCRHPSSTTSSLRASQPGTGPRR